MVQYEQFSLHHTFIHLTLDLVFIPTTFGNPPRLEIEDANTLARVGEQKSVQRSYRQTFLKFRHVWRPSILILFKKLRHLEMCDLRTCQHMKFQKYLCMDQSNVSYVLIFNNDFFPIRISTSDLLSTIDDHCKSKACINKDLVDLAQQESVQTQVFHFGVFR